VHSSKKPELPIVLLEDVGALLGLLLALTGVTLAILLHDPRFDAAASAAIGALLCGISALLSIEMKSLLIGESASPGDLRAIRHALATTPRVRRLIHLRTLHLGPDQLLVGAKLELDASLDFAGVAGVINQAEAAVRASVPTVRILYLEPDTHDPKRDADTPAGAKPEGTTP
jgi:divalent metal cation (Fe/Co/Zn/Cd) transporter